MDRDALTIRSYRLCFRLERRIYKIDRFRLPVSWGVPLRSIGYAAAALLALLLLARVPLAGELLAGLHPALRYVFVPAAIAYGLTAVEPDGMNAHQAVAAWVRWITHQQPLALAPRLPRAGRAVRLGDVTIAADLSGPRLRRGRIAGPCAGKLLLRYPARLDRRLSLLTGHPTGRCELVQSADTPLERGIVLNLSAGQSLELRG